MATKTYAKRYTEALQEAIAPLEVSDLGGGLIIATHGGPGGAVLTGYLPNADKRKPVAQVDVDRWIEAGVSRLRRDMYHYTEKAKADALELLKAIGEV